MKPIRIEDLFDYRFLSSVDVSPTGGVAAFLVKRADLTENGYRSDIHVLDLERLQTRRLTTSGKDGPFTWAPSGDELLFASKRGDTTEGTSLYRIAVSGGEAEPAFDFPHTATAFRCLPDGRVVYMARVPLDPEEADIDDAADYEVLEEIPFWQNGKGFTSKKRVGLYLYDPASDEAECLTDPELEIQSFDIHGTVIATIARRFPGKAELTDELWIHDLSNGHRRCLSRDELSLGEVRFLDGTSVVTPASDLGEYGRGQNRELFVFNVEGGSLTNLTPGWDRSIGNSVVADCRHGGGPLLNVVDGKVHLVITERSTSKVVSVAQDGSIETVAEPNGSVDAYAIGQDGEVVTIELRPNALHEIYLYRNRQTHKASDLNANSLKDRALSLPEAFSVQHGDIQLDAWIVKPSHFDPSTTYPAILTVHGGPRAAFGDVFFHEMQVFADQGYVLIYTNPRGSSGRGNAFADLRGKYGTIDYDDLMAVVDAALEKYSYVDGNRLGIMGGSYGGFMANWVIGQTDRFKAAASQRSISNWTCKFNTTDIGYYFNQDAMGATPWEEGGADKLWWHSPLKYADRAVTPTLFIHSEEDYRCWLAEGLQMFTALKYHGVDSRLVMFRGENHELSRSGKPKHRERRLREMLAWFDRYLRMEA